ncbi:MAG TPA: HAMP domain-containing sensor histidine kinase, partial [Candidatus Methanofastidiosa archaeon]|nr:HAMP domain-containing sensor histidine kinase [Candidatus Methanofastidiosa archaeon]
SELLYRTLTENIPNCCLVLYNNALEVVFAGGDSSNNMFKDVKDPASVFWELFEEDTLMALESGFTRALHDVKQSFEIVHESRNFDVYTLPIKNYGGHVELAMAMIYDITERKRTEKELIDQRKELSDYAHIVSHNLKNQLITINAYAQLILEGDEDSPIFAKSLMKTVKKVNEYISGQLKLAEAGRNIGDLREVDLNQLVNRIGKNFLIEIKGNDLPTIMGDPKNIEEVFINLVSNSFKHGKADKVSIYSQIDGEWNRIVFEDNGVGIPDQYVDDIFNLGFSTDGTGFGLAIVKKIIESHGGSIRLLPSNGTGASFEILFPLSNS